MQPHLASPDYNKASRGGVPSREREFSWSPSTCVLALLRSNAVRRPSRARLRAPPSNRLDGKPDDHPHLGPNRLDGNGYPGLHWPHRLLSRSPTSTLLPLLSCIWGPGLVALPLLPPLEAKLPPFLGPEPIGTGNLFLVSPTNSISNPALLLLRSHCHTHAHIYTHTHTQGSVPAARLSPVHVGFRGPKRLAAAWTSRLSRESEV